jgi:hypothetical protein
MNAPPQLVDVLRRMADKAILPLQDEDPLQRSCEEYQRLWAFSTAALYDDDDDDDDTIKDEVRELSDELERHIVETVATSKIGLICQLRIAQHEIFKCFEDNPNMDALIDTVVRGIVALVPEKWDEVQP